MLATKVDQEVMIQQLCELLTLTEDEEQELREHSKSKGIIHVVRNAQHIKVSEGLKEKMSIIYDFVEGYRKAKV